MSEGLEKGGFEEEGNQTYTTKKVTTSEIIGNKRKRGWGKGIKKKEFIGTEKVVVELLGGERWKIISRRTIATLGGVKKKKKRGGVKPLPDQIDETQQHTRTTNQECRGTNQSRKATIFYRRHPLGNAALSWIRKTVTIGEEKWENRKLFPNKKSSKQNG